MNVELKAYRYEFPFKEPLNTGSGLYAAREGIIFTLLENEILALGEAAPLAGFSTDRLDEVVKFLNLHGDEFKEAIQEKLDDGRLISPTQFTDLPSLQFAFDTLVLDYKAKKARQPLRTFLFNKSQQTVPLNVVLPLNDAARVVKKSETYWRQGYRTFKIKVGINFERELSVVRQIRERYPGANIRIDANQSWGREEAAENLNCLNEFNIEYCEEPLSNPTGEKLHRLQQQVDIPIALDESLYRNTQIEEWISQKIGEIIIIKPMFLGSFRKIFETYRLAVTHEYTTVFTTSLESGIGRIMTATLASGLGAPQFAHGLATGSLLKMDVWHDRAYINSGYFNMPDGYGLGEKRRPTIQDLMAEPLDL